MILQNVSEEAMAFDANQDLKSSGLYCRLQPVIDSDTSLNYKEVGNWLNGKLSMRVDSLYVHKIH